MEQTLLEATETFQEKEDSIKNLQDENIRLMSELETAQTTISGMAKKTGPFTNFFGKENFFSGKPSLSRLKGGSKASSTASLCSQGTAAHQVTSTCATPYKAMHTKSSLLRLKAVHDSPCKVEKCLDQSCHVNALAAADNGKHKSSGLEADTRATKKRKAATSKRRTSNVFKRVYETRSRKKKN